jgi:membrane protein insertase Oxa1/YidC/SpoIIIJ
MLARFPAGLVLYWTWNNLLTVAQQWIIMRRAALPVPLNQLKVAGGQPSAVRKPDAG